MDPMKKLFKKKTRFIPILFFDYLFLMNVAHHLFNNRAEHKK